MDVVVVVKKSIDEEKIKRREDQPNCSLQHTSTALKTL